MPDEIVRCEIDFRVNDSQQSVVAFLRRVRAIFEPHVRAWLVDLTKCDYLGPDAASILVAAVLEARRLGVQCEVTLPTGNAALEAFCEFSGLRHYLTGAPLPNLDHPENVTIPIRIDHESNFSDPDPIIRLIKRFVPLLDENEDYLRICVNEIIQNVEDHATSPIGCATCARYMKNIGEVRVAIVDRGRGIGSTLRRRYPEFATTNEALRRVLQGGYSAKSRSNNMGVGISNLCNIIVHQLHGELFIVSEDAYADGKFGRQVFARDLGMRFPGTGVFFTVPVE